MAQIYALPDTRTVEAQPTQTILSALLAGGIQHPHACGGNAACSTCRVMILVGQEHCNPLTPAEKALAKRLDLPVHIRLACQTRIRGDVTIQRLIIEPEDFEVAKAQIAVGSIGSRKPLAVLYTAIRGLSDFDEENFPYDILYTLGRYYYRMTELVKENQGVISSNVGLRLLALFGTQGEMHPMEQAIQTGLAMLESVEGLNHSLKQLNYQPLSVSVGIHYGSSILVHVDAQDPSKFSVMGDNLNFVGRVEAANAQVGSQLLISETVYTALSPKLTIGRAQEFPATANRPHFKVYEVTSLDYQAPSQSPAIRLTQTSAFQKALNKVLSIWQSF